ncbi:SIMPL domain-containing protein [Croceicoccus sp. F390]|uniref:SIMPL domain-containing protein n=1 Tax=Croceicoccus esteveae TaxID=3075597 RepID=A0ABU2ZIV4_9SPHN|nr:SIMPL domain-containing protein [Croceicoccus sp. F390]MDT0576548.1 SIMPL domain-containing protein [Croceicoccus sp. F390]
MAVLMLPAGLSVPAHAAEVQVQVAGPAIELAVSQTVLADPDMATISAGVTTRAPTATAAMQQNAQAMQQVIGRIAALGIPDRKIQTTGVTLNPRYDYRNDDPPKFLGYDASNTVRVELTDIAPIGRVLDTLVEAGATNLSGPDFGLQDPAPAQAQARSKAFETAQARAQEFARMAGYAGVRLLAVQEIMHSARPMPMQEAMLSAPRDAVSTPVKPGQVGTAVNLTVKFEMTR